MLDRDVLVVRTGTANMASVLAGLRRAGAEPKVTVDPAEVKAAGRVVLPGVGAFGAAMDQIAEHALQDVLVERMRAGKPTLAICLGLQVWCDGSDETPGVRGLGLIPARVGRFPESVRVPQLGWNLVEADSECRLLTRGYAYFANSYRVVDRPEGWCCATSHHGETFVAALEKGAVLGCQFHPELSGRWGLELLRRWLEWGNRQRGERC